MLGLEATSGILFTISGIIIYILLARLLWPWWSRTNTIVEQNKEIIIQLRKLNGEDEAEIRAEFEEDEESDEEATDSENPW